MKTWVRYKNKILIIQVRNIDLKLSFYYYIYYYYTLPKKKRCLNIEIELIINIK